MPLQKVLVTPHRIAALGKPFLIQRQGVVFFYPFHQLHLIYPMVGGIFHLQGQEPVDGDYYRLCRKKTKQIKRC